jgi:hypothetical protein
MLPRALLWRAPISVELGLFDGSHLGLDLGHDFGFGALARFALLHNARHGLVLARSSGGARAFLDDRLLLGPNARHHFVLRLGDRLLMCKGVRCRASSAPDRALSELRSFACPASRIIFSAIALASRAAAASLRHPHAPCVRLRPGLQFELRRASILRAPCVRAHHGLSSFARLALGFDHRFDFDTALASASRAFLWPRAQLALARELRFHFLERFFILRR